MNVTQPSTSSSARPRLRAVLTWTTTHSLVLMLFLVAGVRPAASQSASADAQSPPPSTPEFERLLAPGAKVEKAAGSMGFVEGPVWHPDGYLLFSDIPRNKIMKWDPKSGLSVYRELSIGTNGLTLDGKKRLYAAGHGGRRVFRLDPDGKETTLAEKFEGKRLNSPNDLRVATDGSVYFTDPPYGLPQQSQGKELDFNGVYRISPKGELAVLVRDFVRPNGIVFSPDRKTLYVADTTKMHVRAFDLQKDGSLANGRVFAEVKPWASGILGAPDGMSIDSRGNLYVTGPGGVWVFSAKGKLLGVILTPEIPANCGFGDADFKTLYITARTSLYRIRLSVPGIKP